jgi:hypothetical protein
MQDIREDGRKHKMDYAAVLACICVLIFAIWLQLTEPDYTKIPTSSEWEEMLRQAGKE